MTDVLEYAQVAASFATTATLIFALLQWRAARQQVLTLQQQLEDTRVRVAEDRALHGAQLRDLQAGEHARNAFELVAYLERPDHLDGRRMMGLLADVPLDQWTSEQVAAGELVSGMWEVAATLERLGRFPPGFLADLYGGAIVRHWTLLEPLVERIRKRSATPDQRLNFQLLAESLR